MVSVDLLDEFLIPVCLEGRLLYFSCNLFFYGFLDSELTLCEVFPLEFLRSCLEFAQVLVELEVKESKLFVLAMVVVLLG